MSGTVVPFPRRQSAFEPLLTKKQLALHLGFSPRWIELRMRDGLPSLMVGGRRRYRVSEVTAWLNERAEAQ